MSTDDYNKQMAKQFKYLDQIDIEKYMRSCGSNKIGDLMSAIEEDYDNTDFTNNDFLEGFIFNWCNEEEFIEYLEKRYGERFSVQEYSYHVFYIEDE